MKPRVTILEAFHAEGIELLEQFAEVEILLGLSREDILEAIKDSVGIIVRSVVQVDKPLLDAASKLVVVGRAGTGTENIDLAATSSRQVVVLTTPTGNTVSAAEFTISQILGLCRNIKASHQAVERGDFRRQLLQGRELGALTVGLVGLGNVGMAVARLLKPFGCRVIGWDPTPPRLQDFLRLGGEMAESFNDLLPNVDVLSFHVRQSPETTDMLDDRALALAKHGLLVVNTARGGVIDQGALVRALESGRVAAAALDVITPEPPFDLAPDEHQFCHPLLNRTEVVITPHMAASTEDAQRRIARDLARQLGECLN